MAKRRLKFFRKPDAPKEQDKAIEATVSISLDQRNFETYSKRYRPTADEFRAMLTHLKNKGLSAGTLQLMTGIPAYHFQQVIDLIENPEPVHARMIWLLYMIDTQPRLLNDPFNYATWGKVRGVIPDKGASVAEVKNHMAQLMVASIRATAATIAADMGATRAVVYRAAQDIGYELKEGKRGSTDLKITNPQGIWMNVNWRNTVAQIAVSTGMSENTVRSVKTRLRKVGRNTVLQLAEQSGIDPANFRPLFNGSFNEAGKL